MQFITHFISIMLLVNEMSARLRMTDLRSRCSDLRSTVRSTSSASRPNPSSIAVRIIASRFEGGEHRMTLHILDCGTLT